MTPTDKQIDNFYKSKAQYEAKLDEALKTIPKMEDMQKMINDLITSTTLLRENSELQGRNIDKLMCGYDKLNTEVELLKQANEYDSKKLSMPAGILIAVVTGIIMLLVGTAVNRFTSFL